MASTDSNNISDFKGLCESHFGNPQDSTARRELLATVADIRKTQVEGNLRAPLTQVPELLVLYAIPANVVIAQYGASGRPVDVQLIPGLYAEIPGFSQEGLLALVLLHDNDPKFLVRWVREVDVLRYQKQWCRADHEIPQKDKVFLGLNFTQVQSETVFEALGQAAANIKDTVEETVTQVCCDWLATKRKEN